MFLGHYGIAFAAKRSAPRASLGALTFAAQFLDELWPILLLLGVEQVRIVPGLMPMSPLDFTYYPFSHSLVMAVAWGILVGGAYFLLRRYGRGAWVMAVLVVSHWFLDLPVHREDLPLWPGDNRRFGFGLWKSVPLTMLVEGAVYLIGITIYLNATRAKDRIGSWGFWILATMLVASFLAAQGPPPPNERALALTVLGIWIFVPLAWWIDRHREPWSVKLPTAD